MKIEVRQLSECPELLTAVGTWIYEQWWSKRYDSSEAVLSWLRKHTQKDKVPFTVVAFADGVSAGSCCVIENDCVLLTRRRSAGGEMRRLRHNPHPRASCAASAPARTRRAMP
jgi:hypothetical protein